MTPGIHYAHAEFYWRISGVFGTFLFTPAFSHRVLPYAGKDFPSEDFMLGVAETVEFVAAGMLAPPASKKRG